MNEGWYVEHTSMTAHLYEMISEADYQSRCGKMRYVSLIPGTDLLKDFRLREIAPEVGFCRECLDQKSAA